MGFVREVGHFISDVVSGTIVVPITTAPSPGSLLTLPIADTNATVTGVTDSKGNTWNIDCASIRVNVGVGPYITLASSIQDVGTLTTSDTVTVQLDVTQSGHRAAVIHEFVGYTNSVDQTNEFSGGNTNFVTRDANSVTTTNANDLIYAGFVLFNTDTGFTPGTGYISPIPSFYVTALNVSLEWEYQEVTTVGTYHPTGTGTISSKTAGVVAAYKAIPPSSLNPLVVTSVPALPGVASGGYTQRI